MAANLRRYLKAKIDRLKRLHQSDVPDPAPVASAIDRALTTDP